MTKGKYLALDYGSKRIGVATGEADFGIAFPRDVIKNGGFESVVEELRRMCDELAVSTIVVGLPLNMNENDEVNPIMVEVRGFVDFMKDKMPDIDVIFFDERLTTYESKELMKKSSQSGDKKLLGRDAYSAQIILQRFFDKLNN